MISKYQWYADDETRELVKHNIKVIKKIIEYLKPLNYICN